MLFRSGFEPKTELGKSFKRLVLKSQGVEKAFDKALNGQSIDQLMTPAALFSPEKREKSKTDLVRIEAAFKTYFKESHAVNDELFALFSQSAPNVTDKSSKIAAQMNSSAASLDKLVGIAEKMIAFIGESKPTVRGGVFEFATDAQVARYNSLIDEYNAGTQALQDAEAKALRERQQEMSESIRKADSMGL